MPMILFLMVRVKIVLTMTELSLNAAIFSALSEVIRFSFDAFESSVEFIQCFLLYQTWPYDTINVNF